MSNKPDHCVVLQRRQARASLASRRDCDWNGRASGAAPVECVPVESTHPLYILHTSGTTGTPKGVVRDNGGHAVTLKWSLRNVYDMRPGDVFWAASDIGWVVGHSYIVYAPLLLGCTTLLYEGKPVGTPDAAAFWRVVSQHGVNALFTAPTALRAVKREDPGAELVRRHDLTSLRTLFLAGERADPDTVRWCEEALGVPVIDHWWQTETGWPIASNCMGLSPLPVKRGSPAKYGQTTPTSLLTGRSHDARPADHPPPARRCRRHAAAGRLPRNVFRCAFFTVSVVRPLACDTSPSMTGDFWQKLFACRPFSACPYVWARVILVPMLSHQESLANAA